MSAPGGANWPDVTLGSYSTTVSATCTNGSASISAVSPTFTTLGSLKGCAVSGTGIAAGTYLTASSGTTGTLSAAYTGTTGTVTLTIEAKGAADFLSLITHERKMIGIPYSGGTIINSATDWARWHRVKWGYRRLYRPYTFEFMRYFMGRYPYGGLSGDATDNANVGVQAIPTSENTASHPNYRATPYQAAGAALLVQALRNKGVYVLEQTIPDVAYDMAAGATIEVYFKGCRKESAS